MRAVVIPAKNEAATIAALVTHCRRHAELVVVADDGSTDATAVKARHAGATVIAIPQDRPGMSSVYRGGALFTMIPARGVQLVAEVDAGGSHDPEELPRFWAALSTADVAFGRRFGPGAEHLGHWKRKALSLAGTVAFNLANNQGWHDACSGFVAYRREAGELLHAIEWRARGHFYQSEMRARAVAAGMRTVEVPITYRGGTGSSLNWRSIREALALLRASS